jgi:hypothetical protein
MVIIFNMGTMVFKISVKQSTVINFGLAESDSSQSCEVNKGNLPLSNVESTVR